MKDGYSKLGKDEKWGHAVALPPYGLVEVSKEPPHSLYYQQGGNLEGEPVIVVHGGPGGGCLADYYKYFDPKRYRVILFDQRGCGHSQPTVMKDPEGALKDNNTPALVEDINKLRDALGIQGKAHMFGGSWGSTLSLAYAIAHPDKVKSLQLRGIFLGKSTGYDYLYQGNAATYDETKPLSEQPCDELGTYRAYGGDGIDLRKGQIPLEHRDAGMASAYEAAWRDFVTQIPKEERSDMVGAYSRILEHTPRNAEEADKQLQAAVAWSVWEGTTSYLKQDTSAKALERYRDPEFAINFARIENRYFMHGLYLDMKPGDNPDDFLNRRHSSFILDNLDKIKDIPTFIVHGEYDQVCPIDDADDLEKGLKAVGGNVKLFRTLAGHSAMERDTATKLVEVTGMAPKMSRLERNPNPQSVLDHAQSDDLDAGTRV